MPFSKRMFDVSVALTLLLLLWPVLVGTMLVLLLAEGRPVFYLGERMCSPTRSFMQIKFRTMRVGADAVGGVTGGDKAASISPLHRILRRTRADELPQLINVLKGDMSLVGPRPPMRSYVEAYPEIYGPVLQSRPGITGLATLRFHQHEEWLLGRCRTHRETEAVYRRRCIPRKARLDLIYQRRRTLWFDIALVCQTAGKPFWRTKGRNDFPLAPVVARIEPAAASAGVAVPVPAVTHPAE
ncbi:sugar transferase [Rubellimicrobium roseum]|uniref:Sugar transferase n=2 Tax=Rubellimicrobium roseum TaxID=687525 RepID=A0A5C4NLP3_9RHOB|nr:sugar transferase [Rubellimicrobium roseum]TNC75032.1 sugar transferase [Rubellimicrobium roseum]